MRIYPVLQRAAPSVALALLTLVACTESATEPTTGAFPSKPSFAPGGGGSISVNLDQCANNVPRGGLCAWQNGDINGSNSEYAEGLAVPFRLSVDGLTPNTTYQIHLNYDWTAGGHKAYDFLTSVDATESVNVCAAGGGGTPLACAALGSPSVHTFPENNFPANISGSLSVSPGAINFAASPQGGAFVVGATERELRLYGGTINTVTQPTHTDNQGNAISDMSDLDGNTEADIIVTFTTGVGKSSVLFTWGGHLAQSAYWDGPGNPDGAGEVSGAPWHMRTQQLQTIDGKSAGNKNQDRSIQPSAIIEPPAMTISKNAGAATVTAGSPISFTIIVNNNGAGPAEGFVLNDPLPTGTGINWQITNQSGPVTCAISAGVLRCPATGTGTFPAGATLSVTVSSPTVFASCGTYNNTATVSITNGSSPDPAIAQTIVQCPLLGITKTADASAVSAGSPIGFTITVNNTGQGAATNVTLTDALPGGPGINWSISPANGACNISGSAPTQTLSCNFGTLAAVTGTASVHVVSQTTSASCNAYPNTASAQATNHAQVQAQATTTVNCGEIRITKVADASPVNAGDPIGFTITVSNAGQGNATSVVMTDVLPGGLGWSISPAKTGCSIASGTLTCNFGTMAPGGSESVHVTSPTTFTSCATIPNTASVTTGNDGSAEATASVVVRCPSLSVSKTPDLATVNAGSPIGFTITVTNNGLGLAKSVTLSDALPGGSGVNWSISPTVSGCGITGSAPNQTLSCNFGDLASGASASVHVTSGTAFASCKTYPNTASAQATNHPQVQGSASLTVQCPSLTITKVADAETVSAGTPIGFTITVSNSGPGLAADVTLDDPLPTGSGIVWTENSGSCSVASNILTCNFGNIAAGANASVHVTSPTTGESCKAYPNTASAQATNHAQVQASATTTVACAAIDIAKAADATSVSAGDPIGFTITVSNTGAGSATSVVVTDVLPTNAGTNWSIDGGTGAAQCSISTGTLTCTFGTLGPAATRTVHISSPTTAATCGLVNNSASVATGNDGSDQASASVTVNCPDVTVLKTAGNGSVSAGDPVSFTIEVKNIGVGLAKNVTLNDPLPAGLTWSENSGDCSITANVLSCSFGDLAQNATKSVMLSATSAAANCGVLTNTATVAATNEDLEEQGNNSSTANITVNCGDIKITKVADASPVSAGDAIGFTIEVKNQGAGNATTVVVTDVLPTQAGLSWTISPAVAGCSITTGTLTCNFGTLAPNATRSVHITSPTTFANCATIPNTASVATGNDGSGEASASVVVLCPALGVTKTADAANVSAGSAIGFTIAVTNTGQGVAKSVSLTDALPGGSGVDWSINPANGACNIGGSPPTETLTCNFGNLAAVNGTASVHVVSQTTGASCKTYENTASAQATNHGVVQAQASTTVDCPNIAISKTPDGTSVSAGEQISFSITVTNNGQGTATNVHVTDNLPPGTGVSWAISPAVVGCGPIGTAPNQSLDCTFASLAPGESKTIRVVSSTTGGSCKTYNNTASFTTGNNGSGSDNGSITVQCPHLTIEKTPDQGTAHPGGTATFSITVTNDGLGKAFGVVMTDPLPPGLTWTDDSGSCSIASLLMTCNIGTMLSGGTFTVNVSAPIPTDFLQDAPPVGGGERLQIDGNLLDEGTGIDWENAGIVCATNTGCDLDKPTGSTDDSFGQGTKEDTQVPSVVNGSIPNNKSDLQRFYVTSRRVTVGSSVHDILYLAWERVQAPNGTTNMDFELNQGDSLTINATTPVRLAGDILIKYDLGRGGSTLKLGYHKWVTAASAGGLTPALACEASNSFPCWGKVKDLEAPAVEGASNVTTTVPDPIAPNNPPRNLTPLTFGEAGVDLQLAGIFNENVCTNFGRAYLKSRSSDSFSSELKDFIKPIPISVTNCENKTLTNTATVTGTNLNQAGPISDTGQIEVIPSGSASLFTAPLGRDLAAAGIGTMTTVLPTVASIAAAAELVEQRMVGTSRDGFTVGQTVADGDVGVAAAVQGRESEVDQLGETSGEGTPLRRSPYAWAMGGTRRAVAAWPRDVGTIRVHGRAGAT